MTNDHVTEENGEEIFGLHVDIEKSCLKSLAKVPPDVAASFLAMTSKILADSTANGLHVEPLAGARDRTMRSVRVDRGYRAIGSLQGRHILFLHVNEHDKAYRWARGREISYDETTNRIRILVADVDSAGIPSPAKDFRQAGLFDAFEDDQLVDLGVGRNEIPGLRALVSEADLTAAEEHFDATTFDILVALQSGYDPEDIPAALGNVADDGSAVRFEAGGSLEDALGSEVALATIFVPKDETELRRVLEGDMQGWRVFLHPLQRRFAYRDYNGPALVRGGAGTGKTVVAMHRARYLADKISHSDSPELADTRVLFTTFTRNLARDIEANLHTLCPEHLERGKTRIEVRNLDAWVFGFLKREGFDREIVFSTDDDRLNDFWAEAFEKADLPEGLSEDFVKNEWAHVVQAKGLESRKDYFDVSRVGRGTALDRKKRAALWPIFETVRARMTEAGLASLDDAYREAINLIGRRGKDWLPYSAVVVDEAQDMGEQAFRLVREIAQARESGERNSIFIVGDAHQRIYNRRASLHACGIDVRGRSRRLRLNYRTSENIRAWAVSVLEGVVVDDLDEEIDTLSGYRSLMNGPDPEIFSATTRDDEFSEILRRIEISMSENASATIAVLLRKKLHVDAAVEYLENAGQLVIRLSEKEADDPSRQGIRVATMHRAKGLEFDVVFLAGIKDGEVPPTSLIDEAVDPAAKREAMDRERCLLHVAATRARRRLYVSWNGAKSFLIP